LISAVLLSSVMEPYLLGSDQMGELRLVASREVQGMLGVSRTRAYQITNSKSFPDPVVVLSVGRIWRTEDVEWWIKRHRPDLHDVEQ
jgi:prophage regulatory protein